MCVCVCLCVLMHVLACVCNTIHILWSETFHVMCQNSPSLSIQFLLRLTFSQHFSLHPSLYPPSSPVLTLSPSHPLLPLLSSPTQPPSHPLTHSFCGPPIFFSLPHLYLSLHCNPPLSLSTTHSFIHVPPFHSSSSLN